MIDLYTYRTSNGRKVSVMLEECALAYETRIVDITAGEQDRPAFRAINPNGRIPAIVDRNGPDGAPLVLFESGAILLYLAQKTGLFLPTRAADRWRAIQWLMWQMGGVGPAFGQAFHFLHQHPADAPPDALAYGRARYGGEVERLCGVMDARLADSAFLAGDDYTVADIATYPWIAILRWFGLDPAEPAQAGHWPHLVRWHDAIRARPAVRRGMDVPSRAAMDKHARNAAAASETPRERKSP